MDSMSDAISKLLDDPETVRQIMSLKDLLISDDEQKNSEPPAFKNPEKAQLPSMPTDTIQTVMKLMPLISDMQKDDDTTRLLKALKPFLSVERRKKLDEAAKLQRLTKLLPLIRQLNL